jgi:hypothetical protein
LREVVTSANDPLAAAVRVSEAARHDLAAVPGSRRRFSRSGSPTSLWRKNSAGRHRFRCWQQ